MAAKINECVTFVIILLILGINAQNTTLAPATTSTTQSPPSSNQNSETITSADFAECTCDLTTDACNVECCCDPDCSDEDKATFSQCIDYIPRSDSQTCVQSDLVFLDNSPYLRNETVDGLFCVEVDNYEERNYYNTPAVITNDADFETAIEQYADYSYKYEYKEQTTSPYYKSGNPIYTVYNTTNTLGVLSLPSAMTSASCVDSNPAAYLYDQLQECVREIAVLQTECTTNLMLNAYTYYEQFSLVTNPNAISNINETIPDDEVTGDNSTAEDIVSTTVRSKVAIIPTAEHLCHNDLGINLTCTFDQLPKPSFENNICKNTVIKVHYFIETNGTSGIGAAKVQFTFADITASSLPLLQSYQSEFFDIGETNPEERSGNPGYVVGKPVLATRFLQVENADDGSNTEVTQRQLAYDALTGLTVVTATADGNCLNDTDHRIKVNFGEDLRTGCQVKVMYDTMADVCSLIEEVINQTLYGPNPPTHVATFGNVTESSQYGDWVQILGEYPSRVESDNQPGVCQLVLGLHTEVLYADVGSLGNPQPKIVGVKRTFTDRKEVRFQCIGPYCQPETRNTLTQSINIVSSVAFIDVSDPVVGVTAKKPKINAELPADFFYPFS